MPLPGGFRLALDAGVRRLDGGRALVGGSPLRVLQLSDAGARVVDAFAAGAPVSILGDGAAGDPGTVPSVDSTSIRRERARQRLARRLLDAGLAHPVPSPDAVTRDFPAAEVTVIVPVWSDAEALAATLDSLAGESVEFDGATTGVAAGTATPTGAAAGTAGTTPPAPGPRVLVVDDASPPQAAACLAAVAAGHPSAVLLRRTANGGPGAARQTGLEAATTPLVAFLDAGVRPEPGWLVALAAHLVDPEVVAVAPRVRSRPATGSVLDRYERQRSPLDLGGAPARVAPRTRVAYVPTAALLVRRAAVDAAGGFDRDLRTGEDVDLVWRLVEAGGVVRYEPAVVAWHEPRRTWAVWAAQRFGYGRAAGPLERRHPGQVPPLAVSGWSVLAWGLAAAGHPALGLAVAGGTTALLARKLAPVLAEPGKAALRLGGLGHLHAGRSTATALTRAWWPLTLAAALAWRRARPVAAAAALVPPLLDLRHQRDIAPPAYLAARLADDLAYGAGVWRGCWEARRVGPLRADLRSWPGRALGAQAPSSQLGARSRR